MNRAVQADLRQFSEEIAHHKLVPLWERPHPTRSPVSPAKPAHWDYDGVVRPFMMRAGGLITAKEAERRVLFWKIQGSWDSIELLILCLPACSSLCPAK
jgi:gentisate 1,2-dioxygenase